jgi:hypothetical protein
MHGMANPVADRAVSLWKTFYNWLELVNLKLVDPDTTTFEIYVSLTVNGDLVKLFRKAATDTEATQALSIARDLLWGAPPKGKLQVIVLDHAPRDVWGGIANVAELEEWRDGKKLVPVEWVV